MNRLLKNEIVHPKQSNYDTYFIPEEVEHVRDLPLYRLVSYWGMQKQNYICRDDIATAFGISLRQASGIISSIYRKHKDIVCSVKRVRSGKGNISKNYMLIHTILNKKKSRQRPVSLLSIPRSVREKRLLTKGKHLWSQLISRPVPRF